jgi:hypothetical protein
MNVKDIFTEIADNIGQSIGASGDAKELAIRAAETNISLAKARQNAEIARDEKRQTLIENVAYMTVFIIFAVLVIPMIAKLKK